MGENTTGQPFEMVHKLSMYCVSRRDVIHAYAHTIFQIISPDY